MIHHRAHDVREVRAALHDEHGYGRVEAQGRARRQRVEALQQVIGMPFDEEVGLGRELIAEEIVAEIDGIAQLPHIIAFARLALLGRDHPRLDALLAQFFVGAVVVEVDQLFGIAGELFLDPGEVGQCRSSVMNPTDISDSFR